MALAGHFRATSADVQDGQVGQGMPVGNGQVTQAGLFRTGDDARFHAQEFRNPGQEGEAVPGDAEGLGGDGANQGRPAIPDFQEEFLEGGREGR